MIGQIPTEFIITPVTETSVTLGAMIVELSSWMIVEALMAGEDTTTEIDMIHTEEETLMMMTTIKSILVEVHIELCQMVEM